MATVNLGSIKFKWKGTYSGATAYTVDDVVEYNGSSYICILASTGNLPTNATYFEQMSQKGTDADLLSIAGTAQGDILYRDGSGLQRLGAGTAGQVLQTGGAGANPSWTTVSSDMVKIGETEITSSVSSVTLDNIFTTDYYYYEIIYRGIDASNNNTLKMRLINTVGTEDVAVNYWSAGEYRGYLHNSGTSSNAWGYQNSSDGWSLNWAVGNDSAYASHGKVQFFDPRNYSQRTGYVCHFIDPYAGSPGTMATGYAGGFCNTQTQIRGVVFRLSTGTLDAGKFFVYGRK